MTLVWAIHHWRHYLQGREFTVLTDHKSLKSLLKRRITTPDQHHWLAKPLGFEFEIKFKPGISNGAAAALSRRVEGVELCSVFLPVWLDWETVQQTVNEYAFLSQIIKQLRPMNHPCMHWLVGNWSTKAAMYCQLILLGDKLWRNFMSHSHQWWAIRGLFKPWRGSLTISIGGAWRRIHTVLWQSRMCQRQKYLASSPFGLL